MTPREVLLLSRLVFRGLLFGARAGCLWCSARRVRELTREHTSAPWNARLAAAAAPQVRHQPQYRVFSVPNVQYYHGADAHPKKNLLDLYLPQGVRNFPVLLFVHGGGWMSGDKCYVLGTYGNVGRSFARRGIGVAVANYRLSPRFKHPTHVRDVAAAWAWLVLNIERYGGSTDAMFIGGQSAGAHLASFLVTDPSYLASFCVSPRTIRGVIAISGVFDLYASLTGLPAGGHRQLLVPTFGDNRSTWGMASPLRRLRSGLPPFLVMTGERNPLGLRDQSARFALALREHGVPAEFVIVSALGHFGEIREIGRKNSILALEITQFMHGVLASGQRAAEPPRARSQPRLLWERVRSN